MTVERRQESRREGRVQRSGDLLTLPHVLPGRRRLRFFRTLRRAVEHICHHLLTSPECLRWRLLSQWEEARLSASSDPVELPQDANERYRVAKGLLREVDEIERNQGEGQPGSLGDGEPGTSEPGEPGEREALPSGELHGLCGFYARQAALACDEAKKSGWWTSSPWAPPAQDNHRGSPPGKRYEALGLLGVYVVFDAQQVVSVYLPQLFEGSPDIEMLAQKPSQKNPLPREGKLSLPDWDEKKNERRRRAAMKRRRNRSLTEQIYYEIFRPSVRSVRQRVCDSFDITGRRISRASALGATLPPMSRLSLEDWKRLLGVETSTEENGSQENGSQEPAKRGSANRGSAKRGTRSEP